MPQGNAWEVGTLGQHIDVLTAVPAAWGYRRNEHFRNSCDSKIDDDRAAVLLLAIFGAALEQPELSDLCPVRRPARRPGEVPAA